MPVTRAHVNHGRWVVECECRTASEAVPKPSTHPYAKTSHQARYRGKTWVCPVEWGGCGMSYDVLWPDTDRIMAVLRERPKTSNQNWMPGESISQLVAENLEHGCAVPEREVGA
jgi:hypothetical protein